MPITPRPHGSLGWSLLVLQVAAVALFLVGLSQYVFSTAGRASVTFIIIGAAVHLTSVMLSRRVHRRHQKPCALRLK